MSSYVSHYHLYLDELHRPEELPSSKLFMNGEWHAENDIDIELAKPLLQQNWENVWHRKLRSSSANEEKQLHVCGSRFGQLFFEAIARTQNDFKCSEDNSSAPLVLLNISLSERVGRFAVLCEKHNFVKTLSFVVNIKCMQDATALAQELSSAFRDDGILPVRFAVDEVASDLTLHVATSLREAVELGKDADLVFILDKNAASIKADNCLMPSVGRYIWAFNTVDAFKNVVTAYIENTLIAPAFMKLHFTFGEEKFGELAPDEIKEWLTLSRNRPFSYAMVPSNGVVENPFWIELGSVGSSIGDAPALLLSDDCDSLCESYRDSGRMTFTPSRVGTYHARWESRNDRQCIIVSVMDGGGPDIHADGDASIKIENHGLSTFVKLQDGRGQSYSRYTIPIDWIFDLDVVAKNEYDSSLIPKDADEWQWEILGAEGAVVERHGSRLTFRPTRAGDWRLRVFWPDQTNDTNSSAKDEIVVWKPVRNLQATVNMSVLNRAEAIRVKIEPIPKKGHPSFEVKYMPDRIYAECFPGDGFAMSAWLEGKEPLWNRTVRVEGLTGIESWDDKDKVFKRGFGKPGKKEFKVMSIDDSDNLVRCVEINYKVNHSDTTRGWMIPCMILAVLSAFCSYGLNWFNFILYVSPMCVAGIHFKLKLPMYRRLMGIMLVIAALLFLHALWQEVF